MPEPDIKRYLDDSILLWRDIRDGKTPAPPERRKMAPLYVDAFQSVRLFVCGELLGEVEDPTRIPDSQGPKLDVELRADSVARQFHERYERLAPDFSYKTREASAVPWEDVPENNVLLMRAVVRSLLEDGVIRA